MICKILFNIKWMPIKMLFHFKINIALAKGVFCKLTKTLWIQIYYYYTLKLYEFEVDCINHLCIHWVFSENREGTKAKHNKKKQKFAQKMEFLSSRFYSASMFSMWWKKKKLPLVIFTNLFCFLCII